MNEEFFIKLLKGLNTLTGELLEAIEGADAAPPVEPVDEAPKAKGKKPKKEKPAPVVEEDEEETTDEDADDMGFEADEGADEEDEDAPTKEDVIAAFKAFVLKFPSTKEGREAAAAILAKHKAKKIDDLKPAVYAEVIALTKKKKK